jgi:hypothetical protein
MTGSFRAGAGAGAIALSISAQTGLNTGAPAVV